MAQYNQYNTADVANRIQALLGTRRLEEAEILCDELCQREPANAIAWGLRGSIYSLQGLPEKAVESYYRACQQQPGNAALHCNLGYILQSLGRYADAENCYRKALAIQPGIAQVEVNLGYALSAQNNFKEALIHYQGARKLDPQLESAIAGEADVLEKTGQLQQAYHLLDPYMTEGTSNTDMICQYAALSRNLGLQKDALLILEKILARQGISIQQCARLHFSAGLLYDDTGQYKKAFSHYVQGNKLVAGNVSLKAPAKITTEIISTFSTRKMAQMHRADNKSECPVFIIGMPRSGTSLVEQILASHRYVFGAGELPDIHEITRDLQQNTAGKHSYPTCCKELTPELSDQFARRYLDKIEVLSGSQLRVTDKTPLNFLHLGLISLLLPRAHIIHCVRNPLDTCLSCFFRLFARGNEFSYALDSLGEHYIQYARLMKHWNNDAGIPMLEVRYEDLVENQESVSRSIIEYCGLDWDEQCLQFHRKPRSILSPSYDDIRKPIYRRSVGRWRNYEDNISQLKAVLGNAGLLNQEPE